jgi:TonB family protein
MNQQRIDEPPVDLPSVSVNPNVFRSRPIGDFNISDRETNGPIPSAIPEGPTAGQQSGVSVPINENTPKHAAEPETAAPPPPPARPRSIGVANGYAKYLPKPVYPASALSMGITGKVDVQITIDEYGNVISAKAASGNVLLRNAAESAAWKAKFTPTLLSKVPVKVTGVIVYNFNRN